MKGKNVESFSIFIDVSGYYIVFLHFFVMFHDKMKQNQVAN